MNFVFKSLQEKDIPLLHDWLNRPHVSVQWDGPQTLDEVSKRYGALIRSKVVFPHVVFLDEKPLGYIQSYIANTGDGWWPNEPEGTWGVDQFIAEEKLIGLGIGSGFVRQFTDDLLKKDSVTRIITDPSPENLRAIKAYEKAGFVPMKEILTPDGPALLMEKI